jgi:hypothetical protein
MPPSAQGQSPPNPEPGVATIAHPPELPVSSLNGGAPQCPVVSQTLGAAQSFTDPQVIAHAPPAQAYGAQSFLLPPVSTTVWPSESHLPAFGVHFPSVPQA